MPEDRTKRFVQPERAIRFLEDDVPADQAKVPIAESAKPAAKPAPKPPGQPVLEQDCGTGAGGFKSGNVCAGEGGGGGGGAVTSGKVRKSATKIKAPPEKKLSPRAARAKASHNPSSKAKQDESERAEVEFTKQLGGKKSGDNLPMDIVVGDRHGVELKVMHDVKDGRVNMRPDSRARKEAWAKESKGRTLSTVLIDNRDTFGGGKHRDKYSGHKIYFAQGVGAFRLNSMTKVGSFDELKKLIAGQI